MSRILLGVSGGIAAYKALELVRLATGAGHAVRVVQTPASTRFVGRASFEALTGAPVLIGEFERDPARGSFPGQRPPAHEPLSHLELVANADLYVVAPASANTLAKLALGLADNLLTSCALAATCPLVVAPAMNSRMYEHPATRANLRTLRERGVRVLEPGAGRLASRGEHGVGRLAEPARILAACEEAIAGGAPVAGSPVAGGLSGGGAPASGAPAPGEVAGGMPAGGADDREEAGDGRITAADSPLRGLRVLVTAGGTREPIDSVRFVGNRSSGRMGLALAQAAQERGAKVTVIAANVGLVPPPGVVWRAVSTAEQLRDACEQAFPSCDILLMAAAVADFRPSSPAEGKLTRAGRDHLQLELAPTADVLAGLVARRRPDQTLVGFAAEHGEHALARGRSKLAEKGLDAIVVNDVSREDIGFDVDANEVAILTAGTGQELAEGVRNVARTSKAQVAEAILDTVETLRAPR